MRICVLAPGVLGNVHHTIIWICPSVCPSVCPFRIYSVVYERIGTKLGRYIGVTLEENLRALVSMATILIRGLGHKTGISATPIDQHSFISGFCRLNRPNPLEIGDSMAFCPKFGPPK